MVKSTNINNMGSIQQYTVDKDGSIKIDSIKDKSLFELAKSCDTNDDNKLERSEIASFLEKTSSVRENDVAQVYYEQKNKQGEVIKKCFVMKSNSDQLTYYYKNNKPVKGVLTIKDGRRFYMDFEKNTVQTYKDGQRTSTFEMDSNSKKIYQRIAIEKPYKFKYTYEEIIYILNHWFHNLFSK